MSKNKKYLLEVNAVGTLEELVIHLKAFVEGLQIPEMDVVIAEKDNIVLYETTVMTADIKEIG